VVTRHCSYRGDEARPRHSLLTNLDHGSPEWLIRQLDYELAEVMRRANKIKVKPFRAPAKTAGERRGDA
jgi:hypothetical protein